MHFVVVVMIGPDDDSTRPDPEAVRNALLRTATAEDRIEHVRVRVFSDELRIGVLSLNSDQTDSEHRVRALCSRAMASEPVLSGWELSRGR